MKILRLDLIAFGPFQDIVVDFEGGDTDFHILFGPNEAGKSSALRALRHLLFGIPVRTADNFRHPHPALRIGGRLADRHGNSLAFIRRKGQSKTLRAEDDKTLLADDALSPFLGGVGRELFEQMFAIGHDDLIEGGREIVAGGGRAGQALFSAGAGLIRLQSVQQDLETVCDELFKPAAQKPIINVLLSRLQEAVKNRKTSVLCAREWKDRETALAAAQEQLSAIRVRLADIKQHRARLERIHHALPLIARKKELDQALDAFRNIPELADNFGQQRTGIEHGLAIARNELVRTADAVKTFENRLSAIRLPCELLERGPAISALQQNLGSYRKAMADRPGLVSRMRLLQQQAADRLADMGFDGADAGIRHLKLPPGAIGDIQDLGKQYERLTTRLEANQDQNAKIDTRLHLLIQQQNDFPAYADMTDLRTALETAQSAGPIEKKLSENRRIVEEVNTRLTRELNRQNLWSGDLDQLDALPLPSMERIDGFAAKFAEVMSEIEKRTAEKQNLEADLVAIDIELTGMDLAQEVPTEADLEAARSVRDHGWRLISQTLSGKAPDPEVLRDFTGRFENASHLPEAFAQSMQQADQLADRLRREAAQVTRKALRLAEKRHKRRRINAIDEALNVAAARRNDLEAQWADLWAPAGFIPLGPSEMRVWLTDMCALISRHTEWRTAQSAGDQMADELNLLKTRLVDALAGQGKTLEPSRPLNELTAAARACIGAGENAAAEAAALAKETAALKEESTRLAAEKKRLEQELAGWREKWRSGITALSLTPDTGPGAALSVIDGIREARGQIDQADILEKRIAGIDRDCAAFAEKVRELAVELVPDSMDAGPDIIAETLNARLTAARDDAALRKNLEEQLEKARRDQETARKQIDESMIRLQSLCREAQCDEPEKLADIEKQARTKKQLIDENKTLETGLRELSAGATVDEFVAEAGAMDADAMGPEVDRLDAEITALEQESAEMNKNIWGLKMELEGMDGTSAAAGYAEEAEAVLASLDAAVARYCRLKTASVLLARTIEQYRDKYQGPMIRRASELFAAMTLGSFSGVRAEYDEKGEPVLVGIRPDTGGQVRVEGMSDGTADQLYLALRLAGLEQYLETSEPLPFVADDILLRFDDQRASATLNVLAELSKKTQVIFFTHHRHLVDLAQNQIRAVSPVIHTMAIT